MCNLIIHFQSILIQKKRILSMLLCTEGLILYLNKYIPSKVGYFSKIEAILPYSLECQRGSKMEIHVGNLAVELDNLPYGPLSIWNWSERSSTEIKKISLGLAGIGSDIGIGTNSDPLGSFLVISNSFTFVGNCVINYRVS